MHIFLLTRVVAWAFIPNFECAADAPTCSMSENMGWRYLILSLGAITFFMFICRFFCKYFLSFRKAHF